MTQNSRPRVIGIMGNTGSGKSEAARILREFKGAVVIDADSVAHSVLKQGGAAYDEVLALFGEDFLLQDGELDRKKIGQRVFSDSELLSRHTAITHRYILQEMLSLLEKYKEAQEELIIIDAPLLIESGLHEHCAQVWLITAPREDKIARIISRDGLSRADAEARLAAQPLENDLTRAATVVIPNDGSAAEFIKRVLSYV